MSEFRKMRRIRQQISEDACIEILKKRDTGVLAVLGDADYPYAVPVNYAYYNGKIIFHGANAGHKFDAAKKHEKVSFCVIDRDEVVPEELTTAFRSVIVFGRIRLLTQESDREAMIASARAMGLRFSDDTAYIDSEIEKFMKTLCCFEIEIEHMTGKVGKLLMQER